MPHTPLTWLDETDFARYALRVELAPRRYRVQSLFLEPDPDTQFMLERLLPE
ncbi:hypothetical protein [Streptomyces sp. NPDC127092]|uniref:hypothetical protein n=1 Tax=Streptomyces sp. NPDC127092 TaxID=3347135 RepID=UPI003647D46E